MGLYKKIKSGARSLITGNILTGMAATVSYDAFSKGNYKAGTLMAILAVVTGIDTAITYKGMARDAIMAESEIKWLQETKDMYKGVVKDAIEAERDEAALKAGGLEEKTGN